MNKKCSPLFHVLIYWLNHWHLLYSSNIMVQVWVCCFLKNLFGVNSVLVTEFSMTPKVSKSKYKIHCYIISSTFSVHMGICRLIYSMRSRPVATTWNNINRTQKQESPAVADKPARRLTCGSGVTQGHQKWHHSIACIWFPISILW